MPKDTQVDFIEQWCYGPFINYKTPVSKFSDSPYPANGFKPSHLCPCVMLPPLIVWEGRILCIGWRDSALKKTYYGAYGSQTLAVYRWACRQMPRILHSLIVLRNLGKFSFYKHEDPKNSSRGKGPKICKYQIL